MTKPRWTTEEELYLRDNYVTTSMRELSSVLKRTRASITNHAKKALLITERNNEGDFTSFLSPEKITKIEAYLLGFFWADGTIWNHKTQRSKKIALEIKKEDAEVLRPLLEANWNIFENQPKKETWSPTTIYSTSNWKFISFLESFDYKEKRDCSKILEYLPKELKSFWWRGYSDGDGSFYAGGNSIRQWVIAGPYDSDWSITLKLLENLGIFNAKVKQYISPKGHRSSSIDVRGWESLNKLREYLYGTKWDGLGLERKYLKCQECLIRYGWGQRNGRKIKLL